VTDQASPPGSGPVNVYAHTAPADLSPAVAGVPSRVYVPNGEDATVDVIDPATFRIVDHFPVGRLPQHVTPSWNLGTLYVDNNQGNSLTPIDPKTGKPGDPIPVDDPYNLYFTPDGTRAVVVAEARSRLDFRDPHTWAVIKELHVPCRGVDHADFSADGKEMILSCEFSGHLLRVDVSRMEVTGTLEVGGSPVDVRVSPDGAAFFVANQKRNGVSVIDARTFTEAGFIKTGTGAHGLYPSRDATSLYVSNRLEGTVSVVSFASRSVVAKWKTGGSPDMGGVSTDGTQLWLSGRYHRAVYVIDTRSGTLIRSIPVGRGPHGLCVFPQPGRLSLGHTGNFR
jgi:DNA-binding beta-propeller fold protein YncE